MERGIAGHSRWISDQFRTIFQVLPNPCLFAPLSMESCLISHKLWVRSRGCSAAPTHNIHERGCKDIRFGNLAITFAYVLLIWMISNARLTVKLTLWPAHPDGILLKWKTWPLHGLSCQSISTCIVREPLPRDLSSNLHWSAPYSAFSSDLFVVILFHHFRQIFPSCCPIASPPLTIQSSLPTQIEHQNTPWGSQRRLIFSKRA